MEQEKIWEAFQNDPLLQELGFSAQRRFEFIAKHISRDRSVLNIGVGNGYLENILIQKGVNVSCLDPSDSAIEKIRDDLALGANAQTGYSQKIPFPDASFDYVVMSEVLEHLDEDVIQQTLIEVKRVINQNGKFLGTVPADENLKEGIVVCPKCGECFHRWGHVQTFSKESLSNKLSIEFNTISIQRVVLSDFKQLNWKGKIIAVLKEFQVRLNFKGNTQNFFFVAKL